MRVEEIGRCQFRVWGASGEPHTVDLGTYNNGGKCDCWPFIKTIKPAIEAAIEASTYKRSNQFRCPHIRAARDEMLDRFLDQLDRQFPDNSLE